MTLWEEIWNKVQEIATDVENTISDIANTAKDNVDNLKNDVGNTISSIISEAKSRADNIYHELAALPDKILEFVNNYSEDVRKYVLDGANYVYGQLGVIDQYAREIRQIPNVWGDKINELLRIFDGIRGRIESMYFNLIQGLQSGMWTFGDWIVQKTIAALADVKEYVKGIADDIKNVLGSNVGSIIDKIKEAVNESVSALMDKVGNITDAVREIINRGLSSAGGILKDVVTAIKDVLEGGLKKVAELSGKLAKTFTEAISEVLGNISGGVGDLFTPFSLLIAVLKGALLPDEDELVESMKGYVKVQERLLRDLGVRLG